MEFPGLSVGSVIQAEGECHYDVGDRKHPQPLPSLHGSLHHRGHSNAVSLLVFGFLFGVLAAVYRRGFTRAGSLQEKLGFWDSFSLSWDILKEKRMAVKVSQALGCHETV